MKLLQKEIENAELGEINLAWCVLKRWDGKFGIKKKLEALAYLFQLQAEDLIEESVKDEEGRILDKPNRDLIHEMLINAGNGVEY